jgi:predicted XRE-type DNA-binding protein
MVAMSMSNREVISLVKNSKKNVKKITHISDKKTLSFEDKMKISICKHFVQYMNEERITLTALSKQLKLPKSRVSEIVNYKISKYKVDKLITNLLKLSEFSPKTKAYLGLVGEALEFPAVKVSETKKLTKTIKNIHQKTIEAYA